MNLGFTCLLFL